MPTAIGLLLRRNANILFAFFFALILAAIIAQTWWAITQDRDLTLAAEKGNGLVAVRLLQEHATQTLQDAERHLLNLAQVVKSSKDGLNEDQLAQLAREKLRDNLAVKSLQFINADGQARVKSLDYPDHVLDVSERQEVKFLLRNPEFTDSVIGHPYQSRYDSQLVMPVVRNLYDQNGMRLGLISADVRIAYFGAVYARAAKDNDATASLFANKGFIIVRSPFEARYVDRDISAAPALAKLAQAGIEGSFEDPDFLDDEKARLYTYRKVTGFPITTVYGRNLDTIMAPWRQRSIDRVLFSAATLTLLGVLIFYLGWHVRRLEQSQSSLSESENKFIDLFQHSPLPLSLVNLENDQITECNQVFLQQFQFERGEVIGRTPLEINIWRYPERRKPYLDLLLAQKFVDKMEVEFLRKDGQCLICQLSSRLLDGMNGKMVIFSPIDITRQRQFEFEIRKLNHLLEQRVQARTQSLEKTNQELAQTLQNLRTMQKELIHAEKMAALGSLVAGVAHELNTPIGNAMTLSSSLADENAHILQIMRERNLRRSELENFLQESAEASVTLLRNLVRAAELVASFKQVAVDQASNHARQFDLRRVLEEIVLTSANMYRQRNIVLEMDVPSNILMYSYPGAVSQAISNCIMNAVVHGFEGRDHGRMHLHARLQGTETVDMVFSDDGNGIAPEHLNRVFDPFFTTRLGQGGNGLGMHIVYNQVTGLLGGNIHIESGPGMGTRVFFSLPLCAPGLQTVANLQNRPAA